MVGALKATTEEWIGNIPESWDIERMRYSLKEINVKNSPVKTEQILSLVKDKGVMLYEEKGDVGNKAKEDITGYKVAFPDTLIVNSMNILIGSVGISKYKGCVSPVYYVFKENEKSDLRYIDYIFNTREFQRELRKYANGILEIRLRVSATDIFNRKIPVPTKDEQIKIADFLDEKCAEIDKLSDDIQKQIDILNDYKKSVITRAVTKGLDMNVEMKDSQVDWVKNIPKTWKVTKLKYLFDFGKGLNITKADLVPEGLPVVSYGQIHSKLNDKISLSEELLRFVDNRYQVRYPQCRIKQGNFVFADTSEDYEGCGNCVYKRDNSKVFAGYHSIILKAKQNSDNRYLAYLFTTDLWRKQIRTAVSGVKVFSITQNILSRASVILPPEKEKLIIADYLDSVCSDIEYSISAKYSQLENLTIYKKSIIYEYVTGKKRVV